MPKPRDGDSLLLELRIDHVRDGAHEHEVCDDPVARLVLAIGGVDEPERVHAVDLADTACHIANLKFHRIVRPGQTLRLEYSPQPGGALRIELHADDALVMSGLIQRRPP